MSDWQTGDLAVCIDDATIICSRHNHIGENVKCGRIYRIVGFGVGRDFESHVSCDCPTLMLEHGKAALRARFRKIRPDEHEACENEFITLLNRSKRKVSEDA